MLATAAGVRPAASWAPSEAGSAVRIERGRRADAAEDAAVHLQSHHRHRCRRGRRLSHHLPRRVRRAGSRTTG